MTERLEIELLELETKALAASGHPLNAETAHKQYPSEHFAEYQNNLFCEISEEHKTQYEKVTHIKFSDTVRPASMKSVLLSSAMTFNLLGNGEIRAKDGNAFFVPGTYSIEYEKKLVTVSAPGGRQVPTYLNAFLLNGTDAIFCEMEMTEWLRNRPLFLDKMYFEKERYFFNTEESSEVSAAFEKLRDSFFKIMERRAKPYTEYKLYHFRRYDAWRMYMLILSIYNMSSKLTRSKIEEKEDIKFLPELKTARLANVIFEPPEDAFSDEDVRKEYRELLEEEHEEFAAFKKCFEESGIIAAFKKDCGIDFSLELLTAAQFMDCFDLGDRADYLQRYRLDKCPHCGQSIVSMRHA